MMASSESMPKITLSNDQGRSIFDRYRRFHYGTKAKTQDTTDNKNANQLYSKTQDGTNETQLTTQQTNPGAGASAGAARPPGTYRRDDPDSPFHTPLLDSASRNNKQSAYVAPLQWQEDPFPSPVKQRGPPTYYSPEQQQTATNGDTPGNSQQSTEDKNNGNVCHDMIWSHGSVSSEQYASIDRPREIEESNDSWQASSHQPATGRHGNSPQAVSYHGPQAQPSARSNEIGPADEFSLEQLMHMYRETQESVQQLRAEVERVQTEVDHEAKSATERIDREKEKLRRRKEQLEDYHSEEMTDLAKMTQMAQRREAAKLESALRVAEAKHRDFIQEQSNFSTDLTATSHNDDFYDEMEGSSADERNFVQRGRGLRSPEIEQQKLPKREKKKRTPKNISGAKTLDDAIKGIISTIKSKDERMRKLNEEWRNLERTEAEANEVFRAARRDSDSNGVREGSFDYHEDKDTSAKSSDSREKIYQEDGRVTSATAMPAAIDGVSEYNCGGTMYQAQRREKPPPLDAVNSPPRRRYSNDYSAEVPSIRQMLQSAIRRGA